MMWLPMCLFVSKKQWGSLPGLLLASGQTPTLASSLSIWPAVSFSPSWGAEGGWGRWDSGSPEGGEKEVSPKVCTRVILQRGAGGKGCLLPFLFCFRVLRDLLTTWPSNLF